MQKLYLTQHANKKRAGEFTNAKLQLTYKQQKEPRQVRKTCNGASSLATKEAKKFTSPSEVLQVISNLLVCFDSMHHNSFSIIQYNYFYKKNNNISHQHNKTNKKREKDERKGLPHGNSLLRMCK